MTDQPTAETGAEAVSSIEDTLSKTFDAIEARDDGNDGEGQDTADTGAEESPTAEAESATDEVTDTTDQDGAKSAGTADDQPLSPHERWSAEIKAEFASLPRKAQEILLKREADVTSYLTQESQKIADLKRNYEPLDRIIGPRREAWALSGFTTDTALEHLFALSDFATRDKPGFIRWFAQQHGVDIGDLSAGGDTPPDPQIKALESRVQSFEQKEHQREQAAIAQRQTEVKSAIESFAADTKANPYFKDVESDVATILPGIVQQNPGASHKELLAIAYAKAIWANPDVRGKMLAEENRKRDLEAAKAADKAKKLGSTNVKTSGSVPDGRRKLTMDETMSLAYDQATARA